MTVGMLAGRDTAAAPTDSHIDLVSDTEAPPGPAAGGHSASASRQPVHAQADANGNSSAPVQRNKRGVRLRAIDTLCHLRAAVSAGAAFSMLEQAGESLRVLMGCADAGSTSAAGPGLSNSAALQARQEKLLSYVTKVTKAGRGRSKYCADSQGGGSQVACAPPAARAFVEIRTCNVQRHLEITNPLVS